MTVRRIMGTEVEYGISVPGHPHANSMNLSAQIVNSYGVAQVQGATTRWDFEQEHPLDDARGVELPPALRESLEGTYEDPGLLNVILTNGARLYVDHAHPEYSTPEVTNPLDAVIWEKAGEHVMLSAMQRANAAPRALPINLYKNNTDNKGASYGTHENYLMRRDVAFGSIVRCLTPFFVTRQIITGSGRVGIGQEGRHAGFQISQRADFMEAEVGLETTLKRPIINTRDEPHADPELYRRFHVIVGDANLSEYSTFLKLGMTSLVLGLVEAGAMANVPELRAPVGEIRSVSHDWSLKHLVQLTDGRKVTAIDVQYMYLDAVEQWLSLNPTDDDQTAQVISLWRECLDALATDPMGLSDRLDWVAKLRLMLAYRDRDQVEWDEPKLGMLDPQYSDIRPEKGIYHRLVAQGQMKTLITADQSRQAVSQPPDDTRAWFRGECIRRWGDRIFAASWDSIVFELPEHELLQRIPTNDPTKGTRELLETLLLDVSSADELVNRLQALN